MPTLDEILRQRQMLEEQAQLSELSPVQNVLAGVGGLLSKDRDALGGIAKVRETVQAPQKDQLKFKRESLDRQADTQLAIRKQRLEDPSSDESRLAQESAIKKVDAIGKFFKQEISPQLLETYRQKSAADIERLNPFDEAVTLIKTLKAQRDQSAERKQLQDDKNQAIAERQHNAMIQKFSTKLTDSGIPQLDDALSDIESMLEKLPKDKAGAPKDIPGFGRLPSLVPTFMTSGDAKKLRQAIQKLSNVQLKARSGAAVTQPEWARFVQEFGTGKLESEEALRNGLARLRRAIEADRAELERGLPQEAQQEYLDRGGRLNRYQEVSQNQPQQAPKSNLSPEKQARLEELRRKKAEGTLK